MSPFLHPLRLHALDELTHPSPTHIFHQPCRDPNTGDILVANGYLALRIRSGLWLPTDFADAPDAFLRRFLPLPWGLHNTCRDDWRPLDGIRGDLKAGPIFPHVFHESHRPAPSPVWMLGTTRVRLSVLQLVSRLPRAEINPSFRTDGTPIPVRFSAGMGLIAADVRLTNHSRHIFRPHTCPLDSSHELTSRPRLPIFASHLKDWPPPPPID